MNLSPLQLDTNCFSAMSHYHPAYYPSNTSNWSSSSPPPPPSSSLLCPSTAMNYQPSSIPSVLQPIENYCYSESYYPSRENPVASSSEISFCPSSTPIGSGPFYSSDEYCHPSSTSTMMLPQNRANYTRHQLVMLNELYKKLPYPNSLQKTLIAKYIGVSRNQIRIWFQNKRRKVQLIKKGQAKQTKTDVECEYGEYRRHLPDNFLDDLLQELHNARNAPARLPVKRDNNIKITPSEQSQPISFYPTMNSMYYYHHRIEHEDSSHDQTDGSTATDYSYHLYSNRL